MNARQPDRKMSCGTCYYWREFSAQELDGSGAPQGFRLGQCRRNPPTVFLGAQQRVAGVQPIPVSFNPQTTASEFCGEHPDIVAALERLRGRALEDGRYSALYYDRKTRDLNRTPTPQELEELARQAGFDVKSSTPHGGNQG
jgi:hypothetical protein